MKCLLITITSQVMVVPGFKKEGFEWLGCLKTYCIAQRCSFKYDSQGYIEINIFKHAFFCSFRLSAFSLLYVQYLL